MRAGQGIMLTCDKDSTLRTMKLSLTDGPYNPTTSQSLFLHAALVMGFPTQTLGSSFKPPLSLSLTLSLYLSLSLSQSISLSSYI